MSVTNTSAICHVFTTATRGRQKGCWESIGAFLSPRYVLTTDHSVRGMHQITVQRQDGRQSRTRTLNPVVRDATLDVAIIDLLVPIGTSFLTVPRESFVPARHGILKTLFNNRPVVHPVSLTGQEVLPIVRSLSHGKNGYAPPRGSETFTASVPIIPGYSGSPIVAADGKTVLSVVTKHIPSDQTLMARLLNTLGEVSGLGQLHDDLPMIPFNGADPKQFHDWIQSAVRKLGLNP